MFEGLWDGLDALVGAKKGDDEERREKSSDVSGPDRYFVVFSRGPFEVFAASSRRKMAELTAARQNDPTLHAVFFEGVRVHVTRGPYRSLVWPDGSREDVFLSAPDDNDEIQEDGSLGDRTLDLLNDELTEPPVYKPPDESAALAPPVDGSSLRRPGFNSSFLVDDEETGEAAPPPPVAELDPLYVLPDDSR